MENNYSASMVSGHEHFLGNCLCTWIVSLHVVYSFPLLHLAVLEHAFRNCLYQYLNWPWRGCQSPIFWSNRVAPSFPCGAIGAWKLHVKQHYVAGFPLDNILHKHSLSKISALNWLLGFINASVRARKTRQENRCCSLLIEISRNCTHISFKVTFSCMSWNNKSLTSEKTEQTGRLTYDIKTITVVLTNCHCLLV